ncbi:hypothetical protein LP420_13200 [Massilia sp. B-10]|nr:hypothetical protein LP420_13200 [Massilia sp. B-10]
MYYLEQACRTQLSALACGRELVIPPVEVCEHTAKQHQITGMMPKGARLWQAMTRKMGREYGSGGAAHGRLIGQGGGRAREGLVKLSFCFTKSLLKEIP